jgi:hypothetical protein
MKCFIETSRSKKQDLELNPSLLQMNISTSTKCGLTFESDDFDATRPVGQHDILTCSPIPDS